MTRLIVKKIYVYEKKNGKPPSLVVVGEPQYRELDRERYEAVPNIYLSNGVYIESIIGVKLVRDKTLDGVYFAEEQVLND